MALEKVFKIPSLVRKAGQSASKAQPFYSNVDQAIANITQGTGTGAQMLAELLKTKGVAKELKDRPAIKKTLEANKDAKVTKADLERLSAENPPPQFEELIKTRNTENPYQIVPDADGFNIQINGQRLYPDPVTLNEAESAVQSLREEDLARGAMDDTKYSKYTIPGGENYREVLLMLPNAGDGGPANWVPGLGRVSSPHPEARQAPAFRSPHFEEPNVLAHARVIDRVGPNGEKILHVEEIQSDWHQAGRKKGYRGEEAKNAEREFKSYAENLASKYGLNPQQNLAMYATMKRMQPDEVAKYEELQSAWANSKGGVPDAPFKQNWHELVMKRLLDDAARNGYDKVVITPGAEQAKRYQLSNVIDEINVVGRTHALTGEKTKSVALDTRDGRSLRLGVAADGTIDNVNDSAIEGFLGKKLDEVVGKDVAKKIMEGGSQTISGEGLQVGGEGMKGFYDQILPSYLNDYGKRYGVTVGTYEMPVGEKMIPDRAGLGMIRSGEQEMVPFHSFDITPQMREEITTKGVPLYQAAPPVAIGAGAMQEEQPSEYAGGGIIKKAGQVIGKAAQSSGMARPVTATKDLTTLQDFHASLGDRIRERVAERQNLIESIPFKYDKGQRVFTEDSARKNRLPYEILDRTLYGNMPMRADHPVLGPGKGAVIRDPETGKAMRTPYEAGYRVRSEDPEGWQEYVLPETAIKGDVEMAGGGAVRKALKALLPKGQQAILPAAESAANLERFLAESAIKDRLYHSTKHDFSVFDTAKESSMGEGSFFGYRPNMKLAQGEGGNVMPVHLSIKNPKVFESILDYDGFNKKELMSQGHDGVIVKDNGKIVNAVAFQPTQIKSAIGNRGTYDPAEADITKAKGGQVTNDAMWMAVQNKQLRKKHGN